MNEYLKEAAGENPFQMGSRMRRRNPTPHATRLSFPCFFLAAVVSLVLLTSCVSSRADAQEKNVPGQDETTSQRVVKIKDLSHEVSQTISVLQASDLSAEAKATYAVLLCEQAYGQDDESALLEASELLLDIKAPVQIWMEAGIWLLGRKSDNAVFFLEQAHACWPADTSLLMLYAEALKEKGALNEAIARVKSFIEKTPSGDAKLELAVLYLTQKKYEDALTLLKTIRRDERTPLIDLNLGKALSGLNRPEEAIAYFERAKRGLPDVADPLLELGKAYEALGDIPHALQSYEGVLRTDFPTKNVLLKLISLSLQNKNPERALRYVEEAPHDIHFLLIVADLFIEARNYLQATKILSPIADDPDAPIETYLLLADLTWEHMRDLPKALAWLEKMPEEYRKSSTALLLRVHLFARAEQNAKALEEAVRGKSLFPGETKFWESQARILTQEGRTKEALEVMREAVKKWPNNISMLFLMANILDESGDKKAAMRLMEQIIDRQPDNFQALNYVGYTLADENREIDRAIKLLERATSLAPNKAYIVDSLAWAYFRAGRQKDALREIRRAVKLVSRPDPAIWEHYGDIARSFGLTQEAHDAYARALEMHPDNAEDVRKKMAR